MSFFNKLFKTIKTAANVTSVGLEQLSKGLDSINKSVEEAVNLQKIMSDANAAYRITIELINAADVLSDCEIKLSKHPSELIEELCELMPESSRKDFELESQKSWLVMRRPTTSDPLLQAKADNRYQEYLVALDQLYARIRKKCAGSAEYEKCLKKRLISMGCPYCFLTKLCPSAKFEYFSLSLQNRLKTSD